MPAPKKKSSPVRKKVTSSTDEHKAHARTSTPSPSKQPAAKPITARAKQENTRKQSSSHLADTLSHKNSEDPTQQSFRPSAGQMPMSVRPQHLPSKQHTPLIKTTYNTDWMRRVAIGGGVLLLLGAGYYLWNHQGDLRILSPQTPAALDDYQLSISPTPTPDPQKLESVAQQLAGLPESSSSAVVKFDRTAVQSQLEAYAKDRELSELEGLLSEAITQFEAMGLSTVNLKAYQQRISTLNSEGKVEQAKDLTIEAITHAREQEYSYRFHQ